MNMSNTIRIKGWIIMCSLYIIGLKSESKKMELRKKVEEYLSRAEELKELIKSQEG